ncbi:MAG TPA: VOC family protein [Acidimicrobiales bacterium]|nr:VOC family protein [Acidimicrobiales bacterium]
MTADLEIAYLGLQTTDPTGFGTFLADVVGLVPGENTTEGAATWRNDDRVHRLIIEEGPANDAVFVGLEAASPEAFDRAVDRARASGATVTEGTGSEIAARRVVALARVDTPWGVPFELVHGLAAADEPFESPLVPGGFVTKGQGFGHVVFVTSDLDTSDRFARDALGFALSDWLETELAPGLPLTVRFYHCNPRHHSLALGAVPIDLPQKLHHVMVETVSQDNVGAAFDRAWNAGLPIANALGKHDNDKMFSFYVVTPAGFQLEFGYGARTVEEPWTDERRYDRISEWGHQPIQSPLHAT